MRLGIVLDHFDARRGGTERYLSGLAARLAARRHQVRVYCRDGTPPSDGVEIVPVAAPALTRAGRERAFAAAACERARRDGCSPVLGIRHVLDVDAYQPHGGTWAASVEARLRCERAPWRRRLRAALHRLSPRHRFFARADREVFARRPGLLTLAVSPLVRDDVLRRYGSLNPRVELIWPAVDREPIETAARPAERRRARAALGATESSRLLAFVAHDFELKGLPFAIAALARSDAGRDGALLVVVGRGAPKRHAEAARRHGVGGAVRFLGERPDAPALLAACDLLIHPTLYDPCALVTLEALVAGVPVVTTSANGASALLEEGGGRVVEDPADAGALGGAIDALLAAGERARDEARAAGRSLGWEEHLARLEPLLERCGPDRTQGAPR